MKSLIIASEAYTKALAHFERAKHLMMDKQRNNIFYMGK